MRKRIRAIDGLDWTAAAGILCLAIAAWYYGGPGALFAAVGICLMTIVIVALIMRGGGRVRGR